MLFIRSANPYSTYTTTRNMYSPHSGRVFVESVMNKYDAPIDLIVGGHALADSDYGVPGPQSAANAQIPLPVR